MTTPITIAVPKGYLLAETIKRFKNASIFFPDDFEKTRKLFTFDQSKSFKLIMVRPWDVPAYVEPDHLQRQYLCNQL